MFAYLCLQWRTANTCWIWRQGLLISATASLSFSLQTNLMFTADRLSDPLMSTGHTLCCEPSSFNTGRELPCCPDFLLSLFLKCSVLCCLPSISLFASGLPWSGELHHKQVRCSCLNTSRETQLLYIEH